jgi:hypothetical protein
VIDRTLTQSELLSMWERGEGQRPSRRALALLSGAAPDSTAVELAAMPVGRRDATLLALREQLFGSAFTGVTSCPACGEEIELAFGIDEVRRDAAAEPARRRSVEELAEGNVAVEFRMPSSEDLMAIEGVGDLDVARVRLFERCVIRATRSGQAIATEELPARVVELIAARMVAADPQADVQLDVDCPACGHGWREPFDIVTFFWSELAVLARRLLAEVHELASAYGWSEEQILGLSPARRSAYLEMVR